MATAIKTKKNSALKARDFVHLHNHTHHSLLDGLQKINPMLDRVEELGMEAVAITDHGTLSGVIDFYKAAKSRDINPIIGIEAYVASRKHTDKDPQKDRGRYHLLLFAMNNTGYQNLMKLSTIANLDGYYYKPRIDHDLLEKYNEGLIATSACIGSEIGDALRRNQDEQAEELLLWYAGVFKDRFYVEVQDHGHQWQEQATLNEKLIKLADKHKLPLVVTADSHYGRKEDQEAHEILLCVQTGTTINDEKRFSLKQTDLYMKTPNEIFERWGHRPDIIKNTRALADRCSVDIELGGILIPKFPVPKGKTEKSVLHDMTYQGLAWRYGGIPTLEEAQKLTRDAAKKLLSKEVKQRTEYELGIMGSMGFDGYFLIVSDFMQWGKDKGIMFGPGRGSAAGSIVAYAMNITDLDPLKYDLLFERFLNPDRISMPDIDIDIQDTRRDEVIQYTVEKYGRDQVANIVTFGKMAARNAIRDVARVLDVPYAEADRLAKMVPPPIQGRHIPLAISLKENQDLKREHETNAQSKRVFDLAVQLEGTIRSHGVHAAGVVIAPDKITKFVPLEMAQKGVVSTQYSMNPVEELGLLKMDFLGLSNLTIIKNALRIVKRVYGEEIDIGTIPLDDKEAYELFSRGDTTGVFQVESAGMKRYLKQLEPNRFEDIVAMVALYRPGPMQFIDSFINRKHGREKISYMHESMEDALENTYGILVYQEQVMQIAREMCGFTGGQADTLRKAIGKKKADLMAKMKIEFIQGGIETSNASQELMEKLWKQLEDFAAYCFNKSHAACYALIAYQTAYLKAHYPAAFMAALMTSDSDDTDRLTIEISECKHMDIEVVAPDVNESFLEFAVVPGDQRIRYGLGAIKNVGHGAVDEIIRARDEKHFDSVSDFASRVSPRAVNRKAWESLIKAGAFDQLESNRGSLLLSLDTIVSFAQKLHKEALSGQADLFGGDVAADITPVLNLESAAGDVPEKEKLQWERELLGIYLSSHPLDTYEVYLQEQTMPLGKLTTDHDNKKAIVGGIITTSREIITKNGKKMAFVGLEDKTGELELVVFPGPYEEYPEAWQPDKIVQVVGKFNAKDRDGSITELKVLVDSVEMLTEETIKNYSKTGKDKKIPKTTEVKKAKTVAVDSHREKKQHIDQQSAAPRVYVRVEDPDNHSKLMDLKKAVDAQAGTSEVIVVLERQARQAIRLPERVSPNKALLHDLRSIFGEPNIVVK